MSMNRQNNLFGDRISHGSNKFVTNLNNNETEIPEDLVEKYAFLDAKDFAAKRGRNMIRYQHWNCPE